VRLLQFSFVVVDILKKDSWKPVFSNKFGWLMFVCDAIECFVNQITG
jgi:hypothetical protein